MSDNSRLTPREALERERARLLAEAEAKKAAAEAIDRDLAELDRLASKYNLVVSARPADEAAPEQREPATVVETLTDLIARYRTHKDSPYLKLNYHTRLSYDSNLRRVTEDCGREKLADLKAQDIQRFYERWMERGHAMARSLVTTLRMLFGFGTVILGDPGCERLSAVMHNMRFKMAEPRKERLTAEQASAVRRMAHKMGMPSIALAQAFQFNCKLPQKDAIGEWVPISEPGASDVIDKGKKWVRGLRWNTIDETLILRQGSTEFDLKLAPMVMEELALRGERPTSGPVIIYELTGRPYETHQFRRVWRKVARAAGVPDSVYNMDSRAPARLDRVSPAYRHLRRQETE